ncbi:MAG: DUF4350 domain-containing protein [Archangium sp.]|nr:DUF4350 domain-containing protein [Archangium sp.]MDP3572397.1 DUF4350 domain-containing protein [Archangium sp.]
MKKGPIVLGALVLLSIVASVASQDPGSESPIPSITNNGPRGLGALATWLKESGVQVIAHDAPLTQLPAETRVLVIAAPSGEEIREEEVQSLTHFVEGGGTLIYLMPRASPQPSINEWLWVHAGPVAPLVTEPGLEDVGGTTVQVTFAAGLLAGAKRLRLSADRMLAVSDEHAVPVTSDGAVWWMKRGEGEVWLAAGPDLAENARLELADNALFWSHLAGRGPVAFDEFHLHSGATVVPVNLLVTGLQLGFLAALFLWARATRLGPARDVPASWHRSSLEYVKAMASLTRNAGVEAELVVTLKAEFRKRLRDELGIPLEWSWEEADAELARRGVTDAGVLIGAANDGAFVSVSQALARIELR